jgi:hypothetical protein
VGRRSPVPRRSARHRSSQCRTLLPRPRVGGLRQVSLRLAHRCSLLRLVLLPVPHETGSGQLRLLRPSRWAPVGAGSMSAPTVAQGGSRSAARRWYWLRCRAA